MSNDPVQVTLNSPAGPLLLTLTPHGLFAAGFTEGIPRLTDLTSPANRPLHPMLWSICELVHRRIIGDPVPLLMEHIDWSETTPFQRQVWSMLWTVPWGQTISYAELARRIGRPTAVRATARACAANRWAVIIPCHRVIAADGTLGGYRWGLARKRQLLEYEIAHQPLIRNSMPRKDFETDELLFSSFQPPIDISCGKPPLG